MTSPYSPVDRPRRRRGVPDGPRASSSAIAEMSQVCDLAATEHDLARAGGGDRAAARRLPARGVAGRGCPSRSSRATAVLGEAFNDEAPLGDLDLGARGLVGRTGSRERDAQVHRDRSPPVRGARVRPRRDVRGHHRAVRQRGRVAGARSRAARSCCRATAATGSAWPSSWSTSRRCASASPTAGYVFTVVAGVNAPMNAVNETPRLPRRRARAGDAAEALRDQCRAPPQHVQPLGLHLARERPAEVPLDVDQPGRPDRGDAPRPGRAARSRRRPAGPPAPRRGAPRSPACRASGQPAARRPAPAPATRRRAASSEPARCTSEYHAVTAPQPGRRGRPQQAGEVADGEVEVREPARAPPRPCAGERSTPVASAPGGGEVRRDVAGPGSRRRRPAGRRRARPPGPAASGRTACASSSSAEPRRRTSPPPRRTPPAPARRARPRPRPARSRGRRPAATAAGAAASASTGPRRCTQRRSCWPGRRSSSRTRGVGRAASRSAAPPPPRSRSANGCSRSVRVRSSPGACGPRSSSTVSSARSSGWRREPLVEQLVVLQRARPAVGPHDPHQAAVLEARAAPRSASAGRSRRPGRGCWSGCRRSAARSSVIG